MPRKLKHYHRKNGERKRRELRELQNQDWEEPENVEDCSIEKCNAENTFSSQEGTFSRLVLPNGWVEQTVSTASPTMVFYKTTSMHMQAAGLNSTAPLRITHCVQINADLT